MRQWPAIAIFLFVAALAGVFILVGSGGSTTLSTELTKAGVQLFAVAILGGAVAEAFRSLNAHREEQRRIDEYRAATVDKLFDAYHQSKAVRRALRAAGFRNTGPPSMSTEQAAEFHARMDLLNDAQLALERLANDVRDNHPVFGVQGTEIAVLISNAERYVGHIVDDWQEHGTSVCDGADFAVVMGSLQYTPQFLGRPREAGGIKEFLSAPIYEAVRRIQSLRFGTDPADGALPGGQRPAPTGG